LEYCSGCLIKFQAVPLADRPAHLRASFEIDLPVDSIELCATRCYQDGCTGAKYDPESKICSLSYTDKQYCTNAKVNLHYDAKNVTWLHCVNCYSFKESDMAELVEQHEAAATQLPAGDSSLPTTTAASTTGMPAEEPSTTEVPREIGEPVQVLGNRSRPESASPFQRGCAIKFQARPFSQRPPQFRAKFEIELPVDSVELCATRCYQVSVQILFQMLN
ncbi:PAN domain protein, partial [Ancylostoma caninum]